MCGIWNDAYHELIADSVLSGVGTYAVYISPVGGSGITIAGISPYDCWRRPSSRLGGNMSATSLLVVSLLTFMLLVSNLANTR